MACDLFNKYGNEFPLNDNAYKKRHELFIARCPLLNTNPSGTLLHQNGFDGFRIMKEVLTLCNNNVMTFQPSIVLTRLTCLELF